MANDEHDGIASAHALIAAAERDQAALRSEIARAQRVIALAKVLLEHSEALVVQLRRRDG